jgi:hypothetical protein
MVWSVLLDGGVDRVVLGSVEDDWLVEDVEVVSKSLMTTNCDASLSHDAQARGFDGNTLKRATPSSQQWARWPSQQKEVSVLVTLEQEMRSCPPRIAPGVFVSDSPPRDK